jgi:hypothetical protein
MRWSQGEWSEDRITEAVNHTNDFFALPYGPSGVAPDEDVKAVELYFERLQAAGLDDMKRPDLLIFNRSDKGRVEESVSRFGGIGELPFTPEDGLGDLLSRALVAVECENSLWKCSMMPDFGKPLRPMARLGGRPGLPKGAVVPTIILKEEDRIPLCDWQQKRGVPIHIWHVFFDKAYGIALDDAERLIREGAIEGSEQVFQAAGGPTTRKIIYKIYYHHAYEVGVSRDEPQLEAAFVEDKNGHILPYVKFRGGSLALNEQALARLRSIARKRT